ncbi:protein-L-isoaspartate O-methyltransferase family protein [Roseibium sp.]|uniref:protein-L-isoaspartate O-methyltransferase family protein n=1 Tax=Roseibium sp. TaxID=1936156 RepID=UPI003A987BDB
MNEDGSDSYSDKTQAIVLEERETRASFVLGLRSRGIGDRQVLGAIERVPRRLFLAAIYHRLAYQDAAVPIECGQSAIAPSDVARRAQALDVQSGHRVLEIGTGSGYQTAVLSHLAGEVHSIERFSGLMDLAGQRLAALKLTNLKLYHGDGLAAPDHEGWPKVGEGDRPVPVGAGVKYDRIIVNGAWPEIPKTLRALLKPGGILLMPVGQTSSLQELTRFRAPVDQSESDLIEVLDRIRSISLIRGRAEFL